MFNEHHKLTPRPKAHQVFCIEMLSSHKLPPEDSATDLSSRTGAIPLKSYVQNDSGSHAHIVVVTGPEDSGKIIVAEYLACYLEYSTFEGDKVCSPAGSRFASLTVALVSPKCQPRQAER